MSPAASSYQRLYRILHDSEGGNIRGYDQDIASHKPSNVSVILTSRSSRMTDVGRIITRTDRELRRAATIFKSDSYDLGTESNRPIPIAPNLGGLTLVDATSGSFHMLLEAWGQIQSLLTSKPLQAITALISLEQGFGDIHFWPRRKKDPLEGMSARQALDVLKAYGGDTRRLMGKDRPNLEIEIKQAKGEDELFTHPELPGYPGVADASSVLTEVKVSRSGEVVVRGQRITCIINHPDGSQSIVFGDGY
jgi:hypothetical protein